MFIGIDAWGTLGKNCLTYLTKGRGVRVVGRLRQDRWNDREGAYRDRIYVAAEHVEFKRDRNKGRDTEEDETEGAEEAMGFTHLPNPFKNQGLAIRRLFPSDK